MSASPFVVLVLVLVLLLGQTHLGVDAKRRKKKAPVATSAGADDGVETITFTDEEDKKRQLNELKLKSLESKNKEKNDKARKKLVLEEESLRDAAARAGVRHGQESKERAFALHKLGRNLYLQDRFEETYEMSLEIARIHGVVDGKDSLRYADALGNVGSVANRMKDRGLCEAAMKRQLRILLDKHGVNSQEVLVQRARMLSFSISDGETSDGYSQEYFEEEMEDLVATMKAEAEKERLLIEGDDEL